MSELKKIVVKRATWLRGEPGRSYLLRPGDQKMCCLGFACEQLGVQRDLLEDAVTPRAVKATNLVDRFFYRSGRLLEHVELMMNVNDSVEVSDEYREQKLKELGIEVGLEFIFED